MRILLTNDDGIHAPGIEALHDALTAQGPAASAFSSPLGEPVHTIAPLTVQSATSHGITYHQPLMTTTERPNDRMQGTAVDGRPADCIKLALANLWPERFPDKPKPDLVISGMNAGANCGINVIYSGTVAAALEAAFLGVPSIAVSLLLGKKGPPDFAVAANYARRAIEAVIKSGLPRPHECININIPAMDDDSVEHYKDNPPKLVVCPMNTHGLNDQYIKRTNPAGEDYYWASGHGLDFHTTDPTSDVYHLMQGHITVTPLWYDLTNHASLDTWQERLGAKTLPT